MSEPLRDPPEPLRSKGLARSSLAAAGLLWGAAPVATRFLSHGDSTAVLLGYRFVPSAAVIGLYLLASRRGIALGGWTWRRAAGLSLVGGLGYNGLVTLALVVSPATIVGIALTTEPLWILIFEALRGERGFSPGLVGGILLGGSGTILATGGSPGSGPRVVLGVVLAIAGTACWAVYAVYSSRWSASTSDKTSLLVLSCLPPVLLGMLFDNRGSSLPHSGSAWLAVAAISLGSTVLAMAGWNFGAHRLGAKLAAPFLYLQPAATIVLSAILLHERPSPLELIGLAVILAGLVITQFQRV